MIHIMMATYNGEKYIREQLDSIFNQSYHEWKLWINDDGSVDNTLAILQEYKEKYPSKIELLYSEQKGRGAKGNFAFIYENVPASEYYAFCDQDDIWENEKLYKLMIRISKENQKYPVLIYHDVQIVDKDKKVIAPSFYKYTGLNINHEKILQQILLYNCVPGCTMLFNHALKDKVAGVPASCFMHDWWLLLSAVCMEADVIMINKPLAQYRQHGNNDMGVVKRKSLGQIVAKCTDIINIRKYLDNNIRMKKERITHAELLLDKYKEELSRNNVMIITDFLHLLTGSNRLRNFREAMKKGYVFYNSIYTLKFFLLK